MQEIELKKGDMLVLETDMMLTADQRAQLQKSFDDAIKKTENGETAVAVLECGIKFDVVKVNASG